MTSVLWVLAYLLVGFLISIILFAVFPEPEYEKSGGLVVSTVIAWPAVIVGGSFIIFMEYVIIPGSDAVDRYFDAHEAPGPRIILILGQKLRRLFVKD
jgi:hypothetical protein